MIMEVFTARIAELLDIEVPEICLKLKKEDKHTNAKTYFIDGKCKVYINPTLDLVMSMICITHELRHCYQMECVYKNLHDEPKELVNQWKSGMENYTNSKDKNYVSQDIELDAMAFSYYVMMNGVGVKVLINGEYNEQDFNKKIEKFENKYSIKKIKSIINEIEKMV